MTDNSSSEQTLILVVSEYGHGCAVIARLDALSPENPAGKRWRGDVQPIGRLAFTFSTGLLDAVGGIPRFAR